jgi:hypothetical protein
VGGIGDRVTVILLVAAATVLSLILRSKVTIVVSDPHEMLESYSRSKARKMLQ